MTYAYPRNTSVMHASGSIESARPRSNVERLAEYRDKRRALRSRVTVPSPLPAGAQAAPSLAARAGRQSYTTGDAA